LASKKAKMADKEVSFVGSSSKDDRYDVGIPDGLTSMKTLQILLTVIL